MIQGLIEGVRKIKFEKRVDHRGYFMETFRSDQFDDLDDWSHMQVNFTQSNPGTFKGLHYHYHQADLWIAHTAPIHVVLYDLRVQSPTENMAETFWIGSSEATACYIPRGVAHGFYTPNQSQLIYLVTKEYNADNPDEFTLNIRDKRFQGIRGFDPETALISHRDRHGIYLEDVENPPVYWAGKGMTWKNE